MNNAYLFTSESVAEGHPDKVADQMMGVDRKDEKLQGAGDLGLMFGDASDASDETDTLMPAPITDAHLVRPIYEKTAAYGHFGRAEPEFTWKLIDRAVALRDAAAPASARRTTKRKAAAPA